MIVVWVVFRTSTDVNPRMVEILGIRSCRQAAEVLRREVWERSGINATVEQYKVLDTGEVNES